MIITKKALPRRTVLRGLGATLALPLLDAMVPALTPVVKTAALPPRRLGFVYTPNGYIKHLWKPTGVGRGFEFSPSLSPLESYRDHLVITTGLAQRQGESRGDLGEGPGPHSRAGATFLTGCHVKQTEGADVENGISADQIAANVLGRQTPLPSLELAIEQPNRLLGKCENNYSCIYMNTLSWRNATTPLPMEVNPRVVFQRLFGDSGNLADRRARLRRDASILDSLNVSLRRLRSGLGSDDRTRLDQYVDSIREVETRIERTRGRTGDGNSPIPERSYEIPSAYDEHIKLMFDLQTLAYQADLTRVITFQMGREQSYQTFPNLGITEAHHAISHHQNEPERIAQKAKIDAYQTLLFSYYLEKLRNTPDGEGSLLDHVIVLYGAGLGDPNVHELYDLGTVIAGGGSGQIRGGRHLRYEPADGTPFMNLLMTLLDKVGVPVDKLGDGRGPLPELSEV